MIERLKPKDVHLMRRALVELMIWIFEIILSGLIVIVITALVVYGWIVCRF